MRKEKKKELLWQPGGSVLLMGWTNSLYCCRETVTLDRRCSCDLKMAEFLICFCFQKYELTKCIETLKLTSMLSMGHVWTCCELCHMFALFVHQYREAICFAEWECEYLELYRYAPSCRKMEIRPLCASTWNSCSLDAISMRLHLSSVAIEILHFGELGMFWDGEYFIGCNFSNIAFLTYVFAGICVFNERVVYWSTHGHPDRDWSMSEL